MMQVVQPDFRIKQIYNESIFIIIKIEVMLKIVMLIIIPKGLMKNQQRVLIQINMKRESLYPWHVLFELMGAKATLPPPIYNSLECFQIRSAQDSGSLPLN